MRTISALFAPLLLQAGCGRACLDATDWYLDADGDGWGDTSERSCGRRADRVDRAGDCDDSDPTVYPGAPDVCGDGRANDCRAGPDPRCLTGDRGPAAANASFSTEVEEAQLGHAVGLGPGGLVVIGSRNGVQGGHGRVDVYVGPEQVAGLTGPEYSHVGERISVGDVTGDGASDILAGGGWYTYLLTAPFQSGLAPDLAAARFSLGGGPVVVVGDMSGDGLRDIAGGDDRAGPESERRDYRGVIYVMHSPVSGEVEPDDAVMTFYPDIQELGVGRSVAGAGDVSGDGRADLLGASLAYDGLHDQEGLVYLITETWTGTAGEEAATARLFGGAAHEHAGAALSEVGDLDGDGYDDIVVGSSSSYDLYGEGTRPLGWICGSVVYGPVEGDRDLAAADARISAVDPLDCILQAQSVAGPGDVDGDGFDDFAIGAELAFAPDDGDPSGAVSLFYGPVYGALTIDDGHAIFYDTQASSGFSAGLAGGDVNDDGYGDLLIGAPYHYPGGAAWLYLGGP